MRIILIGPPGSGKGTHANFIMQRYKIPIISVGNILRNMIKKKSNISEIIKDTINSGHLVSDEIIINLIIKKICNINYKEGFLLDGFPRTATQAYALKMINTVIDFILVFSVSVQSIIERISGRYVHIPSGRIYHQQFNPPKKKGYDDITGERLQFREDDNEKVIYDRLIKYYCYTKPIIYFYKRESLINHNMHFYFINCDCSISDIQSKLIKLLD